MVISTAGESGPCSAWLSRSTATTNGSAASSATIRVSVGPANRSMPTSPKSCRLASATYALPGPVEQVDLADRLGADAPSRRPPGCRRAGRSRRRRPGAGPPPSRPGSRPGSAACTRSPARRRPPSRSPRSCARRRPAGSARPARTPRPPPPGCSAGPRCTPGDSSTSKSASESFWCWAKVADPVLHGADVLDGLRRHPGDDLVDLLGARAAKASGDQRSNFSEYSRTAASPRSRTCGDDLGHRLLDAGQAGVVGSLAALDLR